jgi:ribosome-associated heat shock protein Hsp15
MKSSPSKALIEPKRKARAQVFQALSHRRSSAPRLGVASSLKGLTVCKMQSSERVRIDKWLWAVRLFKSRSVATDACTAGHVKIGGQSVKASREVHVGEIISARTGHVNRTVKVLALLQRRVGASLVPQYLEDHTSAEEYARARDEAARSKSLHPVGLGRPTKKQRRDLMGFFDRDRPSD